MLSFFNMGMQPTVNRKEDSNIDVKRIKTNTDIREERTSVKAKQEELGQLLDHNKLFQDLSVD